MICQTCREHFEAPDGRTRYESVPYGEGECAYAAAIACPVCGSEQVDEERVCGHCEQEFTTGELHDGLCALCTEETKETLMWMWDTLTPAQRRYAAEHTAWMER